MSLLLDMCNVFKGALLLRYGASGRSTTTHYRLLYKDLNFRAKNPFIFASGTAMSHTVLDTVFTSQTLRLTKCHIWQICDAQIVMHIK